MKIPELLSPAGNLETAVAALEYGADAVYLGMSRFSARADVENFSYDDLAVLTGYAHGLPRPRRVHVAVNTLIRNKEMDEVAEILGMLRELQVDAVIVQDLGVARLIRDEFPELTMHASTQMAIHNRAGMLEARELGFKRVISARELTLSEIRAMAEQNGIELEVFIHGALCYAYSGLCLLSSVLRGASGNRGECSYFCRNNFKVAAHGRVLNNGCALMSMKDLALAESVQQLAAAGVASLKIEGRKKTPLWVAAVTNYYRKLLDGTFKEGEREECERHIRSIFSRPWTSFFVQRPNENGITDIQTVGHRGVPCGFVQSVMPARREGMPDTLRFMVKNMPIEKHDGLQVELNGREKPYGFAVEDIRAFRQGGNDTSVRVFAAEPETMVEVPLPEGHPALQPGQHIFCASSQAVRNAYHWPSLRPDLVKNRFPVKFSVTVSQNAIDATAVAFASGRRLAPVSVSVPMTEPLSPARNPENVSRAADTAFAKLGGGSLVLSALEFANPDNYFVPVSVLNDVRRQIAEKAEAAIAGASEAGVSAAQTRLSDWRPADAQAAKEQGIILKVDHIHYLNLFREEDFSRVCDVVVDIQQTKLDDLVGELKVLSDRVGYNRVRLALPPILRGKSLHSWKDTVRHLLEMGWRRWEVANIGTARFLEECGANPGQLNLTADWPLYAMNASAVRQLLDLGFHRVTLAPDDEDGNWLTMLKRCGSVADLILYQDTPLAISAVCANVSLNGECMGRQACRFTEMELTTRKGEQLLAVNNHCQTVYLNKTPLDVRRRQDEFQCAGARRFKLVFCYRQYTPVQVKEIFDSIS